MPYAYLVRLGLMGHVGRFAAASAGYERGQAVVVRTARGLELGEVLAAAGGQSERLESTVFEVLRAAGADDFQEAGAAGKLLEICDRVVREGHWPLQLLDAEPLLDGRTLVLHYLGPHTIEGEGLLKALRHACGLDVWLEPAGIDPGSPAQREGGCGHCESGGCGSGCGAEEAGCGSAGGSHEGGCSGCAVKDLLKARR